MDTNFSICFSWWQTGRSRNLLQGLQKEGLQWFFIFEDEFFQDANDEAEGLTDKEEPVIVPVIQKQTTKRAEPQVTLQIWK